VPSPGVALSRIVALLDMEEARAFVSPSAISWSR